MKEAREEHFPPLTRQSSAASSTSSAPVAAVPTSHSAKVDFLIVEQMIGGYNTLVSGQCVASAPALLPESTSLFYAPSIPLNHFVSDKVNDNIWGHLFVPMEPP